VADLRKAHSDEFLHEDFGEGLINREVQRALGHRVALKLTGKLPQHRLSRACSAADHGYHASRDARALELSQLDIQRRASRAWRVSGG
jgi:hypothetical protein